MGHREHCSHPKPAFDQRADRFTSSRACGEDVVDKQHLSRGNHPACPGPTDSPGDVPLTGGTGQSHRITNGPPDTEGRGNGEFRLLSGGGDRDPRDRISPRRRAADHRVGAGTTVAGRASTPQSTSRWMPRANAGPADRPGRRAHALSVQRSSDGAGRRRDQGEHRNARVRSGQHHVRLIGPYLQRRSAGRTPSGRAFAAAPAFQRKSKIKHPCGGRRVRQTAPLVTRGNTCTHGGSTALAPVSSQAILVDDSCGWSGRSVHAFASLIAAGSAIAAETAEAAAGSTDGAEASRRPRRRRRRRLGRYRYRRFRRSRRPLVLRWKGARFAARTAITATAGAVAAVAAVSGQCGCNVGAAVGVGIEPIPPSPPRAGSESCPPVRRCHRRR